MLRYYNIEISAQSKQHTSPKIYVKKLVTFERKIIRFSTQTRIPTIMNTIEKLTQN